MADLDEVAIGIDLGTSNSCVAVVQNGKPQVLADRNGERVHASVVAFTDDGKIIVGNRAKEFIATHPTSTIASSKRLMGRFFFSDEVRKAQSRYGFELIEGPNSSVRFRVRDKEYTPQAIGALIIKRMKRIAEEHLGQAVNKAVITVPAYFNDNQRQATRDAGEISGLEVLRIINEPTSAALAYGFGLDLTERVAVYDLGGGTFDVSILEIGRDTYEVLATAGDTYLGGDDIDERIITYLANTFFQTTGVDPREDVHARQRLFVAGEQAKKDLATEDEVWIEVPGLVEKDGKSLDLQAGLTRAELGRMSMDLIQRTFKVTDEALQAAHMTAQDLEGVILVGGPTRLPFIRNAVSHYFQRPARDNVNPDEVVAVGAALQAHSLVKAGPPTMLLDVTPLTLRLATVSGYTEAIIPKNTPLPIEKGRTFTTVRDNQERVQVIVLQGEDRLQKNCEMLAQFEFAGLRPAPRGHVHVEVTFEIDANGIVHVSARDHDTGRVASTEITLSTGMSQAELQTSISASADMEVLG